MSENSSQKQCFETIRLLNGELEHIEYHNIRFNHTRHEVFGITQKLLLEDEIDVPTDKKSGLFKCRVTYRKKIENIRFDPYLSSEISTFKLVDAGEVDYSHKYEDRSALRAMYEKRGDCDEVIIVKNGLISDISIANIAFFKDLKWYTAELPLLPGTTRARLLQEGRIHKCEIKPGDLNSYQKIWVFNAMMSTMIDVRENTIVR